MAGNPSRSQLDSFLDISDRGGISGGGMTRPSTRPGGGFEGGAAGQFLHDNPTPFPSTRPGGGDLAGVTRPGAGGGGQQVRPGDMTRPSRPGQGGSGELRPGGDNRPGRPGQGGSGEQRPGGDNRPGRPGDNTRPGQGGSGELRPGGDNRPGRPGDRPNRPGEGGSGERWNKGDWANHRPDRITDRNQWNNWRNDHRNDVYSHWHNHWHDHNGWYNRNWWNRWGWNYPYYNNFNYWGWAAWPAITGWVTSGWSQPIYYNYGDNVYYDDGQVYYGDQPVASASDYAQQAAAIALSQPTTDPAPADWMPLGVFAVTNDGEPTGADPTMYLQLAVSKQGELSGTFQNTATDTAQEIEGMVDKETQRAAWVPKGKKSPIMETGISNLTQDTTPALVHFADGTTQQWLMVRLDKPKDDPAASAAPAQ